MAAAAGGSSSSAGLEAAAEKLHRLAEERFLASDVSGALRAARKAQAQARTLPGLAGALAAYEVHHAAAASRKKNSSYYAVLGIVRTPSSLTSQVTHEALKRRYRRLCLALHPDKNRSAAAEGAFKLLHDAWAALSALQPPAPATAAAKQPKPQPSTGAGDGWAPREFRSVFCARSGSEYRKPVDEDEGPGGFKCGFCRRDDPPPPPPRRNRFPCPGQCPGCGALYARCLVTAGTWRLR